MRTGSGIPGQKIGYQSLTQQEWIQSRRVFSVVMVASMSVSKGGLYGAATYDAASALTRLWPQCFSDVNRFKNQAWVTSVVVVACTCVRSMAVYGPQVWLQFAVARRGSNAQPCSLMTWFLVQGTSIATAVSGFVGTQYVLSGLMDCPSTDVRVLMPAAWMALSSYVAEYGLGGRALQLALQGQSGCGHLRALSNAYQQWRQQSGSCLKKMTRLLFLIFQSMDESMAMVFLFFRLAAHNPMIPTSVLYTAGGLSALTTGIRTVVLYAPRMHVVRWQHDRRLVGVNTCSMWSVLAVMITAVSAVAKMLASADGYYDTAEALQWQSGIATWDQVAQVGLAVGVCLLLSSAFIAEPYFSYVDVLKGLSFLGSPIDRQCQRCCQSLCSKQSSTVDSPYHLT